jgi:subtilisin-like proprotein convertase family protein
MKKNYILTAMLCIITLAIQAQDLTFCNSTEMAIGPDADLTIPINVSETGVIGDAPGEYTIVSITYDIQHEEGINILSFFNTPSGSGSNELDIITFNGGEDGWDTRLLVTLSDDIDGNDYPSIADWTGPATFEDVFNSANGENILNTNFDGEQINGVWAFRLLTSFDEVGTLFEVCLTLRQNPEDNCQTFTSFDTPSDIDPGATQTADCANNPNFYSVALPFLGEVGTDIRIDEIFVDIEHTFSGDISLLLEDDQGNFIFLAENLGGATDDAYNGTIFQDGGADITTATAPFGTGPYAASGGNLNDVFDGVLIGDDTTWSLVICDNAGDDTGRVVDFSITFCEIEDDGALESFTVCSTTETVIPPNDNDMLTDIPLTVTQTGIIGDSAGEYRIGSITIDIQHDVAFDLLFILDPPSSNDGIQLIAFQGGEDGLDERKLITLSDDKNGIDYPNVRTWFNPATFEDVFNTSQGLDSGLLNLFDGESINGEWQLRMYNDEMAVGTVFEWCIEFVDASTLSTEDFKPVVNINLHPNPATTNVQFTTQIDSYEVYNLQGQKVMEGTEQSINVSGLSTGLYLVNITKNGKKGVEKLVVKR